MIIVAAKHHDDDTSEQRPRFCRGSTIPPVISSGRDLFVVFESSPFSTPEMAPFASNGFQLDVEVKFVEEGSLEYAARGSSCRFDIDSADFFGKATRRTKRRRGVVRNVAHALPANTTCRY